MQFVEHNIHHMKPNILLQCAKEVDTKFHTCAAEGSSEINFLLEQLESMERVEAF